jgi:DNA polymerase III subunit gamma/tau
LESNLVRLALSSAELQLSDNVLIVAINSSTNRNHVQAETPRLLDTLRRRLHHPALKIEVKLDESKAQEQLAARPARPLTAKERLDKMKESNPLVSELLRRFDLKMDD